MDVNDLKNKLSELDNQELELRLVVNAEYAPNVNERFKIILVALKDEKLLMEQFTK